MIIPIIAFMLSLLLGCTPNEAPVDKNTLKLTLIDAAVTETYLQIETGQVRNNLDIILLRDGKEILSFKNTKKDTIVTDTALTENTTYKYTVIGRINGKEIGRSDEITAVTLLPTSHNITWKTYYFGDNDYTSFNDLDDAAIINENDIWAVGEVYINDSLGNIDSDTYGAIHWDGIKWTPMKVPVAHLGLPSAPGGIFAAMQINDEIYVADIANLLKYENNQWKEMAFFVKSIPFDGQVYHIWGNDESSIYCAGDNGSVYHVKGNSWQQINSGTPANILDIWGTTNLATNDESVYLAVAPYGYFPNYKADIIKITNDKTIDTVDLGDILEIHSVWTNKGFPLFAGGSEFYTNKTGTWKILDELHEYLTNSVRGTGLNDIFVTGNYGFIAHYNGKTWHVYNELHSAFGVYGTIKVKGNTICAVGYDRGKAIITIGRR